MGAVKVLAVDPGPVETAYLLLWEDKIQAWGKVPNDAAALVVANCQDSLGHVVPVVCEMVACYGMAVGAEVFDTAVWIGEYRRICADRNIPWNTLTRVEVKNLLCHHSAGVNDSVIRTRLIDLYGGKEKAIGKKKTPGPLWGITKDVWSALAVAKAWELKP